MEVPRCARNGIPHLSRYRFYGSGKLRQKLGRSPIPGLPERIWSLCYICR
jgi:hypothetical protein